MAYESNGLDHVTKEKNYEPDFKTLYNETEADQFSNIDPKNSGEEKDFTQFDEECFTNQFEQNNKAEETDDSEIKDECENTNYSLESSNDEVKENQLIC